ncbi:UNVERIFIED_ORG: hypothetical protein BDK47_1744 [Anoxybacillus amylolyticus]
MKFPFIVYSNLSPKLIERWEKYYNNPTNEYDRKVEEGLWRRTQSEENKEESGWKSDLDARRRMLHYRHHYDVITDNNGNSHLALVGTYLWLHLCFPEDELEDYKKSISVGLEIGGWNLLSSSPRLSFYEKGDLLLKIELFNQKEQDIKSGRTFPESYRILEATIHNKAYTIDQEFESRPWAILDSGIRKKDVRSEKFEEIPYLKILDYLPAQFEIGCGPSIEAGIPPLHFLHQVYYVTNKKDHTFILGSQEDRLLYEILSNTEEKYINMVEMYLKCFISEPTPFYKGLKTLEKMGYLVGPIITNNFDGLVTRVGLKEKYIRRFEETHIIPEIDFHPDARSLIVVGSHADRRKVRAAARKKGLKIIYIDPEGYSEDGEFIPYPLESLEADDILIRESASIAMENIIAAIKGKRELINV